MSATCHQEKADGRHLSFLSACGHQTTREKHHGTSTNDTVVTSRYSTVYYQTSPTKTDGVSESVLLSHRHAVGDKQITNVSTRVRSQMLPIRVCIRFGMVSAATTREGRMKPHAHKENHTARNQTVEAQLCINKIHDKRHLSTHRMPATMR